MSTLKQLSSLPRDLSIFESSDDCADSSLYDDGDHDNSSGEEDDKCSRYPPTIPRIFKTL